MLSTYWNLQWANSAVFQLNELQNAVFLLHVVILGACGHRFLLQCCVVWLFSAWGRALLNYRWKKLDFGIGARTATALVWWLLLALWLSVDSFECLGSLALAVFDLKVFFRRAWAKQNGFDGLIRFHLILTCVILRWVVHRKLNLRRHSSLIVVLLSARRHADLVVDGHIALQRRQVEVGSRITLLLLVFQFVREEGEGALVGGERFLRRGSSLFLPTWVQLIILWVILSWPFLNLCCVSHDVARIAAGKYEIHDDSQCCDGPECEGNLPRYSFDNETID